MLTVKRRACLAFVLAIGACAGLAPAAMATPDSCNVNQACHWFAGQLSYRFGMASIEAHSIIYVQGNAYNDSICVGLATGVAGSYYAAPFYSDCDAYSSGGQASASYGPGCCYHGTVIYAGPASAKTILSPTHYSY